jgi:hypothetical protein
LGSTDGEIFGVRTSVVLGMGRLVDIVVGSKDGRGIEKSHAPEQVVYWTSILRCDSSFGMMLRDGILVVVEEAV